MCLFVWSCLLTNLSDSYKWWLELICHFKVVFFASFRQFKDKRWERPQINPQPSVQKQKPATSFHSTKKCSIRKVRFLSTLQQLSNVQHRYQGSSVLIRKDNRTFGFPVKSWREPNILLLTSFTHSNSLPTTSKPPLLAPLATTTLIHQYPIPI